MNTYFPSRAAGLGFAKIFLFRQMSFSRHLGFLRLKISLNIAYDSFSQANVAIYRDIWFITSRQMSFSDVATSSQSPTATPVNSRVCAPACDHTHRRSLLYLPLAVSFRANSGITVRRIDMLLTPTAWRRKIFVRVPRTCGPLPRSW